MSNFEFQGYIAVPDGGKGPGVLVLHPWWGLNDTVKGLCDRLAGEGFIAYAPDLYHGQVAATIKEAELLSSKLDSEQAKADIAAAVNLLWERAKPEGQGLGVIGFSLGAFYALELSGDDPDRIRAVVLFYGTGPADYGRSKAAYLGHFAQVDDFEPATEVDGLETALRTAGRPVTFYRYEGLGHWFFEPDRPDAYNPSAARLAWERTVSFLKNTLVEG
jgi:carboxymethylenebutenolidase